MDVRETVASRLKTIRTKRELSQSEVAGLLGKTQAYIAQLEKAKREPNLEILRGYALKFGVSLNYIFGLTDTENDGKDIDKLFQDYEEPIDFKRENGEIVIKGSEVEKLIKREIAKQLKKK